MIIQRYLRREILGIFAIVGLVLAIIFLSRTFVRILVKTVEGSYPSDILFSLLAVQGLSSLSFVFPLAFFLGVLLAMDRLYRDSEMSAMTGCGVGPKVVLRSVFSIAVILSAMVAGLSLYLNPLLADRSQRLLDEAEVRAEIEGITPGRFTSVSDTRTLYVGSVDEKGENLLEIFVQEQTDDVQEVIRAASGHIWTDKESGVRYIVLLDGHRYEGKPGQRDFTIASFDSYGVKLADREVIYTERKHEARPTLELLQMDSRSATAELHWRLAMPIGLLLMGMLAVPLSKSLPRQGRYGKMFTGILLYFVYIHFLLTGRSALDKGSLPEWAGLWWAHAGVLILMLVMLARERRLPARKRVRSS